MKTLLMLFLLSFGLFAQSPLFIPYGPWPMCSTGSFPAWACTGYKDQIGKYQLAIHGSSSLAMAYRFTVTGVYPDGTAKTVIGFVSRNDDGAGWTAAPAIEFGSGLARWTVSVEELTVTAIQ